MDTKKVVLAIALCLVLAGALSGCVDQTQQNNETNTSGANTNSGGNGGGGNGGDSGGNGETGTAEEIDVDVENMTVECGVQESVIEPEDTQGVDDKYSNAGPPLDPRKAEAMLHRELNELRTTHGNDSIEPLVCDPNLREIAREHSRVMEDLGMEDLRPSVPEDKMPEDRNVTTNPEYGNLSVRYEGVCRDVTETYGVWLYQRNRDINWDGYALQQREDVEIIKNHEELIRDMRGVWYSDREELNTAPVIAELTIGEGEQETGDTGGTMEYLTDANYTRQGIGMHINRSSREVFVTQVLC